MGFVDDVEKLFAAAPDTCQVALFSATMPAPIRRIAETYLEDPVEVQVEEGSLTTSHIDQKWMCVPREHKLEALIRVLRAESGRSTLVFTRTRAACAEVADALGYEGIPADALHGDLNQSARERVLARFRGGRLGVVIATDVAARGLDVEQIELVVNFDLPDDVETYVHRIGRTGRAGRVGNALSFARPNERQRIRILERRLDVQIPELDVPSDAAIVLTQRRGMLSVVKDGLASELAPAKALLAELVAEGSSAEDVAAALLTSLANARGVDLGPLPPDRPPAWARSLRPRRPVRTGDDDHGPSDDGRRINQRFPDGPPRNDGPRMDGPRMDESAAPRGPGPRADGPEMPALFFPVGANQGLRPGDFVGALVNELGVPPQHVGRITLLPNKTFVAVSPDAATHVLSATRTIRLKGHEVPIALARPNGAAPPPDAPKRPSGAKTRRVMPK
jgi:ATP-dependent RNA helicase DeaD